MTLRINRSAIRMEWDNDELSEDTRRALKRRHHLRIVVGLLGLIIFIVVPFLLPDRGPFRTIARASGGTFVVLAWHVVNTLAMSYRRAKLSSVPPTEELYRNVSYTMGKLGMALKDLRVDDGVDARRFVEVQMPRPGRIILSRRAVEVMDVREMEFLLAFKLRVIKLSDIGAYGFLFIIPFATAGAVMWYSVTGEVSLPVLAVAGALAIASVPLLILLLYRIRGTRDRETLNLTTDLGAAESAIAKMMKHSQQSNLMGEMMEDPKVRRRVKELRKAAGG